MFVDHFRSSAHLNFNRAGMAPICSIWPLLKSSNTINSPKIDLKGYLIYDHQGILTQNFKLAFGNSKWQTFSKWQPNKEWPII